MTQINPSLSAVSKALKLLANPQDCYKSIIIAGTNGKGSVCTFLELFYLNSGLDLKIGKYISPHLLRLNERFSIDGQDISDEELELLTQESLLSLLTEFEQQTIIAFEYFKRNKIDIAILEVGMGGRWDATNVVATENRLATVVTNIGLDHMEYLGETIELIRKEKEAIKRDGVPHYEGVSSDEAPNSIRGENFLLALKVFEDLSGVVVSDDLKLKVLQQFPLHYQGRYLYQSGTIVDGAHNEPAMIKLNQYIKSLNHNARKIFVVAFLDKDYKKSLTALLDNLINKEKDIIICTELNSSRTTAARNLAAELKAQAMVNIHVTNNSEAAFGLAEGIKQLDDLLIITGSLMLVADYYTVYSNTGLLKL